ncbi:MAG: type I-E CRISPR-associated protein Cas5/CasD [Bacteroidota bacterium]
MSHTLLLRLTGPMQSWGLQSRFSIRDTAREPTKSGVLGLVCAALGRPRSASLDDLRALQMAVRVDREGQPRKDFHTAMNVLVASSTARQIERRKPKLKDTEPSVRHYLADAWFTVALQGQDRSLLQRIDDALGAPVWPLALGRKAFVPSCPIRILDAEAQPVGVLEGRAVETLQAFLDPLFTGSYPEKHRIVLDATIDSEAIDVVQERMQPDDPVSFATRRFLPRQVITGFLSPNPRATA